MFTIPDIHSALEPLVCWSGAFTNEEIESIIKIGDDLEFKAAKVGTQEGVQDEAIRKSKVSWLEPSEETHWVFVKIAEVVARINKDKFQFELSHIDALQYTTYVEGEYYGWHIDADSKDTFGPHHRKLGFSLLLSDPEDEFTNGELQIMPSGNPSKIDAIPMKKGDLAAFPSFVPHQVTKVGTGKRKSLVFWVLGPKFK